MEFTEKLQEHAKVAVTRAERAASEEATKMFLVLPMLNVLGYDTLNPDEVTPEHHADFSDKYQNKVDYAIMRNGLPVIAIEVKKVGDDLVDSRGQLRSYFNAATSVKLGILTDGLRWEFYADSDAPNMMDSTAFLSIDLKEISENGADNAVLSGIIGIQKPNFDPANIGTEAKRKLLLAQVIALLSKEFDQPTEEFVRYALASVNYSSRLTKKMLDDNAPLVAEAVQNIIDQRILKRVGFEDPKNLVRVANDTLQVPTSQDAVCTSATDGIKTTDDEQKVLNYVRSRLAFLVETEADYKLIDQINYRDYKTIFRIFLGPQERVGSLLGYWQQNVDGLSKHCFSFPALDDIEISGDNLSIIDQPLLESFKKRAEQLSQKVVS